MNGETAGPIVFVGGLVTFAGLAVAAGTGTIDDLAVWLLGAELIRTLMAWVGVLVVVALAVGGTRAARSTTAHVHGGRRATVIRHEALGHAAVAHGVGVGNIRARLKPGGGGEVICDTSRMSPAEYVAYMRAGRAAAGGAGDCAHDLAEEKRELDCLPADQRDQVSREADRIVRRHVGNAFGHKVARALERDGEFG